MAGTRSLAGKCYCGAVHYTAPDEFVYAMNCHCSNCRRTTGSAFKPFAGIQHDKLSITRGRDKLMIYGEENTNNGASIIPHGDKIFLRAITHVTFVTFG